MVVSKRRTAGNAHGRAAVQQEYQNDEDRRNTIPMQVNPHSVGARRSPPSSAAASAETAAGTATTAFATAAARSSGTYVKADPRQPAVYDAAKEGRVYVEADPAQPAIYDAAKRPATLVQKHSKSTGTSVLYAIATDPSEREGIYVEDSFYDETAAAAAAVEYATPVSEEGEELQNQRHVKRTPNAIHRPHIPGGNRKVQRFLKPLHGGGGGGGPGNQAGSSSEL